MICLFTLWYFFIYIINCINGFNKELVWSSQNGWHLIKLKSMFSCTYQAEMRSQKWYPHWFSGIILYSKSRSWLDANLSISLVTKWLSLSWCCQHIHKITNVRLEESRRLSPQKRYKNIPPNISLRSRNPPKNKQQQTSTSSITNCSTWNNPSIRWLTISNTKINDNIRYKLNSERI